MEELISEMRRFSRIILLAGALAGAFFGIGFWVLLRSAGAAVLLGLGIGLALICISGPIILLAGIQAIRGEGGGAA